MPSDEEMEKRTMTSNYALRRMPSVEFLHALGIILVQNYLLYHASAGSGYVPFSVEIRRTGAAGFGRYATTEACSRSGLTVCLAA